MRSPCTNLGNLTKIKKKKGKKIKLNEKKRKKNTKCRYKKLRC